MMKIPFHTVTRREIYCIEYESESPFSMKHHSFLFCMHPTVPFRNTCREGTRVTVNINLRSKTHLYSAYSLPMVIFSTQSSRRHNHPLTLIPIKLMFLLFVFLLKTKTTAAKLQKQQSFLCRITMTGSKQKGGRGEIMMTSESKDSMSGVYFCLISNFYSSLAVIVPLLLKGFSPVCLYFCCSVYVHVYYTCASLHVCAYVHVCLAGY